MYLNVSHLVRVVSLHTFDASNFSTGALISQRMTMIARESSTPRTLPAFPITVLGLSYSGFAGMNQAQTHSSMEASLKAKFLNG